MSQSQCSHRHNNTSGEAARQTPASDPQHIRHPQHPQETSAAFANGGLTKALFETIVGTLLALYALGTDAHMNGSGTDAAQAGKM